MIASLSGNVSVNLKWERWGIIYHLTCSNHSGNERVPSILKECKHLDIGKAIADEGGVRFKATIRTKMGAIKQLIVSIKIIAEGGKIIKALIFYHYFRSDLNI